MNLLQKSFAPVAAAFIAATATPQAEAATIVFTTNGNLPGTFGPDQSVATTVTFFDAKEPPAFTNAINGHAFENVHIEPTTATVGDSTYQFSSSLIYAVNTANTENPGNPPAGITIDLFDPVLLSGPANPSVTGIRFTFYGEISSLEEHATIEELFNSANNSMALTELRVGSRVASVDSYSITVTPIPEPGAAALLALGAGAAALRRRREEPKAEAPSLDAA